MRFFYVFSFFEEEIEVGSNLFKDELLILVGFRFLD